MNSPLNIPTPSDKTHESISWTLLAGLLLLRLPLSVSATYFIQITWLGPLYEICTYVLTLSLIWWERDRLTLFHIDALTIMIIIFIKPLQTLILAITQYDSILAFPNLPSLIIWIGAVGLFLVIRKKRPYLLKVQKKSWEWFGIGVLVGIGQALLLGYPMSLQVDLSLMPYKPTLLTELLPIFFYQLGYAAVDEEPLFRGFL